eukprot:GILK01005943.1.p1 GENE.GILK01005943.1~~GILK01005943.1.p1  ORF type:complete len:520 (-),score=51.75 GILK01005943.1:29-1558(-)
MATNREELLADFRRCFEDNNPLLNIIHPTRVLDICDSFWNQRHMQYPRTKGDLDALQSLVINKLTRNAGYLYDNKWIYRPEPQRPSDSRADVSQGDADTLSSFSRTQPMQNKRMLDTKFTILFLLPSPDERAHDGLHLKLSVELAKHGFKCESLTIREVCRDKTKKERLSKPLTLVIFHCDAYIELVRLRRTQHKSRGRNSLADLVYLELTTVDEAKCLYPSLSLLRNTQDKLTYMRLMQELDVAIADTWLPETREAYFFTNHVYPKTYQIRSFMKKHLKHGVAVKGSPSGYGDSVEFVHRGSVTEENLKKAWTRIKSDNVDVFLQELIKHCGYDIRTYWMGIKLLYVIATKKLETDASLAEPVFICPSLVEPVFICPDGSNVDGETSEQRTDLPYWKDISQVQDIGREVLMKMEVQSWDFVRLDFLYEDVPNTQRSSRLLLSDIDTFGCYIADNVKHDMRTRLYLLDIVDCLKRKLQSLTNENLPKRLRLNNQEEQEADEGETVHVNV